MNIGILQSAGIAGNIIDMALNHPEQQEVFTPVIYSKENGNDKNVSSDLKFGNIQAIVVAPGSATEFNFPGTMTIYADGNMRVATVMEGATTEALTIETLVERTGKAWMALKRDCLCSSPRIALISLGDERDEELLKPAVDYMATQGTGVFGPYNIDDIVNQQLWHNFDMVLCIEEAQTRNVLDALTDQNRIKCLAGLPMVMITTDYSGAFDFDSIDIAEPAQALRQAIYAAMDICRNRAAYDEAHYNPLPKIYHERKDDSEKVRFAVKK